MWQRHGIVARKMPSLQWGIIVVYKTMPNKFLISLKNKLPRPHEHETHMYYIHKHV